MRIKPAQPNDSAASADNATFSRRRHLLQRCQPSCRKGVSTCQVRPSDQLLQHFVPEGTFPWFRICPCLPFHCRNRPQLVLLPWDRGQIRLEAGIDIHNFQRPGGSRGGAVAIDVHQQHEIVSEQLTAHSEEVVPPSTLGCITGRLLRKARTPS